MPRGSDKPDSSWCRGALITQPLCNHTETAPHLSFIKPFIDTRAEGEPFYELLNYLMEQMHIDGRAVAKLPQTCAGLGGLLHVSRALVSCAVGGQTRAGRLKIDFIYSLLGLALLCTDGAEERRAEVTDAGCRADRKSSRFPRQR